MPRNRTPLELARLNGAALRHPGRFKSRREPHSAPLGDASRWMTQRQQQAFELFKRELPWLREADRTLVEMASSIRARLMAGEHVSLPLLNQLRLCAGQMGATPAALAKLSRPADAEDDDQLRYFS